MFTIKSNNVCKVIKTTVNHSTAMKVEIKVLKYEYAI